MPVPPKPPKRPVAAPRRRLREVGRHPLGSDRGTGLGRREPGRGRLGRRQWRDGHRGQAGLRDMALEVDPDDVGVGGAPAPGQGGEHRLPDRLRRELPRIGLPGGDRPQRRGPDRPQGVFRLPRHLVRPVRQAPPLAAVDPRRPRPASPEGQQRIAEKGPASIRGLFNLLGRKLDLVAEFEDRVPAYVEQMFDRLEASGIIVGWDRDDWDDPDHPDRPRHLDRSRRRGSRPIEVKLQGKPSGNDHGPGATGRTRSAEMTLPPAA